jgi:amino acid adenylation domain-containing protein
MTTLARLAPLLIPRALHFGIVPFWIAGLLESLRPTDGEKIEDSYPLSPLQHGMLFHTLLDRGSGVDIVQEICDLSEDLDVDAFEEAWKRVAQRHPALRTSFQWDGLDEPIQQVHRRLPSLERHDWRDRSRKDQEAELDAFVRSDRRRGFDLRRAPLMRLSLFRSAPAAYRFVWTFHHALMDGWCVPIVLKEVFAFYDAFRLGQEPAFDEPRPYRDYIEWLRKLDLSRAESFWRDALKGFRAPTPLVVDRLDSDGTIDPLHGEEAIRLSESVTSALRSLARKHDLTLSTIFQAAWACLLGRYSGEEDVVFGTTRQCRPSAMAGAESMVGLFINTLPIRARVGPDRSVLDLLRELRRQWVVSSEYKPTPLVDIQRWSEIPRGASLFQSLVVFEDSLQNSRLRAQGGPWTNRAFREISQPNTPLNVVAYGERELLIRISYDRKHFDSDSVSRMLGHAATLLEAMAENADQRLGDLPLLTSAERRQILEWQSRDREDRSQECIHRAFERQTQRTPEAVAVQFEGAHLSYGELNRRANRLARHLRGLGVGPDVLVGVCLNRSLEMVVALLGVLKAGGAYLPLDPAYPAERLGFMIEDARTPVLVTDESLVSCLPVRSDVSMCLLDRDREAIAREEDDDPEVLGSPENLAYVIYTSGSTGRPKGVLVTHRNVDRLFAATEALFGFDEHDVWSLFHSYAFDFSVWELWGALRYGGRVVVVPQSVTRSPEAFRELLSETGVTVLNQTPSAFRQLIEADASSGSALRLRLVIFGGEALEAGMLAPWFGRHGDESPRLVNMYGITETTVHVTHHPLSRADLARPSSVIGRPIPDLQVYILDRRLDLCPIGVPGELHVGGPGLARGYLHRPELTREKFIPNPFAPHTEQRLYGSGDLGRYCANGEIEYLGRLDQQVKIRGHRVEPGEIETALAQHPDVKESAVVAREETPGDVRLIAYLVPRGEMAPPDDPELRAFLKRSLPAYMMPSAFVPIEHLPLTPSGKVDRQALRSPASRSRRREEDFVAPRDPTEQAVAEIWGQVLGLDGLGAHDDFFERGGHSLLATQVVSRIRDWFGVELPIQTLFESPSVAEFAEVLAKAPEAARSTSAIPRLDRESHRPSSAAGARLRGRTPSTPSSKVDRQPLRSPTSRSRKRKEDFVAPRDPTEQAVAEIWGQVLGVDDLGAHDDFFERGGHSLLATQVVSRIRDCFGVELPIRTLFEFPSVAEFARVLAKAPEAARSTSSIPRLDRESHRARTKD